MKTNIVSTWLNILILMVMVMVTIGGVTRLTDSGLSMVTWKPVTGSIPPLTEKAWQNEFQQYKQSPEFIKKNYHFTLSEFKKIYFWEFIHRFWGRLIGLVFFVPFVFFLMKKKITKSMKFPIFVGFILGGAQGLLGWYMVKSGLIDIPEVSHYRLAAHLLLAFLIIFYLRVVSLYNENPNKSFKFNWKAPINYFMALIFLQLCYGAFVAGLDAGLTYNTFPKMGRNWIPDTFFLLSPFFSNFFDNSALVQFIHRVLGTTLLLATIGYIAIKRTRLNKDEIVLACLIFVQFFLGIATLLSFVQFSFAISHQFVASLIVLWGSNVFFKQNTNQINS